MSQKDILVWNTVEQCLYSSLQWWKHILTFDVNLYGNWTRLVTRVAKFLHTKSDHIE